jgi:hypothetical protein
MMIRRRALCAAVSVAFFLASAAPSFADDKALQNVKGSVSYQSPNKAAVPLAINATIGLADKDYAITGGSSLAEVVLPDSSRVMVGSDSKVQLAFFDRTQIANAKFVLYDGRVRFAVRHPQGAKANYTFTTATASVAVRGTQGDIAYGNDGSLLVNVYEVCDPNAPVVVTTKGGRSYPVAAGQSFFAQIVDGIVKAQVQQLTQQLIDQFSPEFGIPTSWDEAQGKIVGYAQSQANGVQSQAAGAVNSVTGGYGGVAVPSIGGLFGKKKATPSPAPTSASCS